jgi:hypothetical protein
MATYCIFKVYDYKGGELSSRVNLSHERFIGELCERFEEITIKRNRENLIDKVSLKEDILAKLNSRNFYSTYAGGDGFVGEMYKVEGDRMISVTFNTYVDDMVEYMAKNWN